jgi:hypothetical protein
MDRMMKMIQRFRGDSWIAPRTGCFSYFRPANMMISQKAIAPVKTGVEGTSDW